MKRTLLVSFLAALIPCSISFSGAGRAAPPGRVFNVREYGAIGDGVTDDTLAIQAAALAMNEYNRLNQTCYASWIDVNNVTILGDGAEIRVEHDIGNGSFMVFSFYGCSSIRVEGMHINLCELDDADLGKGLVQCDDQGQRLSRQRRPRGRFAGGDLRCTRPVRPKCQ